MMPSSHTLSYASPPVNVVESDGLAHIVHAGTSIPVSVGRIPALVAALIVAQERLLDAAGVSVVAP